MNNWKGDTTPCQCIVTHSYAITYYGIAIPLDGSEQYDYIIKRLASKYKELYKDNDEYNFLDSVQYEEYESLVLTTNAEESEIINLNGNYKSLPEDFLILIGDHSVPNLYSTPFKSKDDCINHYKQKFSDILPDDFDYENNIGKITYIIWGWIMTNITTYQQLRANVQQINLIKTTNHILLSKFVSSDEFLDLLNNTRLSTEPIETYVIDNTVQIEYRYKNISFNIILTDKEIVDFKIETILKDKILTNIKEIDSSLNNIENTAKRILEKLENDKK